MPWSKTNALLLALLFLSALPGALPAAPARSGHVVANTRRSVDGKTDTTVAELWFTTNRYRLVTRRGATPAEFQVYDGRAVYRWSDGRKTGQTWHPTGLRVIEDVVRPMLGGAPLPGRKRVGKATVLGMPCAVIQGTRARPAPGDWWKGALKVRLWESQDPRFPFPLRSAATDSSGDQAKSEVTDLDLDTGVPPRLFQAPSKVAFLPPPTVRSGWRIAGGPLPITGTIAFHLASPLPGSATPRGRGVVKFAGRRYVLDRQPIATRRDVEEARLETHYVNDRPAGPAIFLYLRRDASVRVARLAAAARGRYLVILLGGQPADATRIVQPWAEESSSFAVTNPSGKEIARMANELGRQPAPPRQGGGPKKR